MFGTDCAKGPVYVWLQVADESSQPFGGPPPHLLVLAGDLDLLSFGLWLVLAWLGLVRLQHLSGLCHMSRVGATPLPTKPSQRPSKALDPPDPYPDTPAPCSRVVGPRLRLGLLSGAVLVPGPGPRLRAALSSPGSGVHVDMHVTYAFGPFSFFGLLALLCSCFFWGHPCQDPKGIDLNHLTHTKDKGP